MSKRRNTLINQLHYHSLLWRIQTPLSSAVAIIEKRRKDTALMAEITAFLNSDIPKHFNQANPVFYLSRYIATPDYETLQYIECVKKYEYPIVIGTDKSDKFTTHSSLKRNLGKLPIIKGRAKNGAPIIQYKTIFDFGSNQGKRFDEIQTFWNQPLIDFHQELGKSVFTKSVQIVDESNWVDTHSRGDLIQLYEYTLSLFIAHGISLECYEADETDFLSEVVLPAFQTTKKRFGHKPLISPLPPYNTTEFPDINSYPASTLPYIQHKENCAQN